MYEIEYTDPETNPPMVIDPSFPLQVTGFVLDKVGDCIEKEAL